MEADKEEIIKAEFSQFLKTINENLENEHVMYMSFSQGVLRCSVWNESDQQSEALTVFLDKE